MVSRRLIKDIEVTVRNMTMPKGSQLSVRSTNKRFTYMAPKETPRLSSKEHTTINFSKLLSKPKYAIFDTDAEYHKFMKLVADFNHNVDEFQKKGRKLLFKVDTMSSELKKVYASLILLEDKFKLVKT